MSDNIWKNMTPEIWQQIMHDGYGDEPDPPILDWEKLLPRADEVINRVAKEVMPPPAKKQRPPRVGTDLSPWREDIARLLADLHENYVVDLDDFQMRNDPKKPKRWGSVDKSIPVQNVDPMIAEMLAPYARSGFNQDAGEMWDEYFKRKRGNPGSSRAGGPPLLPLHNTYLAIRFWWRERGLGQFTPSFAYGDDEQHHNADSRFLLALMQRLDPLYTVPHARGLYETMRRSNSDRV